MPAGDGSRRSSGGHHREYNALMGAGAIYLALAVRLFLHHAGVMGGLR